MPEVAGQHFSYSPRGIRAARKARERVMTSDGMMLGKNTDLRKKAGVMTMNKPSATAMVAKAKEKVRFPTRTV